MHITTTPSAFVVRANGYTLSVSTTEPEAELDGWGTLNLLASVHASDRRDETHDLRPPVLVRHDDDVAVFHVVQSTAAWRTKTVRLTCTPESIALDVRVHGEGRITDVTLLGGRAVHADGSAGTFRSAIGARSVFNPTPTQPVQVVRPAGAPVTLGVVGDADPGRLHAVFSPPPLVLAFSKQPPPLDLAFSKQPAGHATSVPEGEWLGAHVRAGIGALTFTQLSYEPLDGGALVRFDYEGQTAVSGAWTSPAIVIGTAASPWEAIAAHRGDLIAHGLAPKGPMHLKADWWRSAIFCGWGAQCARGGTAVPAMDLCRQELYDEWLARLERHGIIPGTIVIDDKWQARYGTPEPDPAKWPDLKAWIADRHRRGQRVLLWWRAWAPDGLPAEECITDPAGRAVAADPTNPAYRRRLAESVAYLVGGLDADGFKIDFTQRSPSGSHLRKHGQGWGMSMLHDLLATMYGAAKSAKRDALMITHTPHPAFADVCDMIRLNDVLEHVPAVDQLRFRHAVATRAMPDHLIDTDQWPMPSKADWLAYAQAQPALGVPALYYVDSIDNTGEVITGADLRQVAAWWSS